MHPIEQYLYIVNIIVVLLMVRSVTSGFIMREQSPGEWLILSMFSILVIAAFALIAITSHNGIHGSNVRFE